ncbi:MAG: DUF3575 domain-containing protein [Algoriphagus sp.]|nr:DUF3575 domain-containing protein [Algoriphagus sp.]
MKHLLAVCLFLVAFSVSGQKSDSTLFRRNTVKIDLTSYFLYRDAIVFSYERVVKPHQSFGITLGYETFPSISQSSIIKEDNRGGYKFGGEYRFYLAKENKFAAPRGVYIGPYFSSHGFSTERFLEVEQDGEIEEGTLNSQLRVHNFGAQLGYQFVFNDRWTIDLVLIGPSFSNYRAKMKLEGDFTFDPEDIQNEYLLELIDQFPILEDVLSGQEVDAKGKVDTWALGYRYQFLVGYRFGHRK